jgi:hypothetical protein
VFACVADRLGERLSKVGEDVGASLKLYFFERSNTATPRRSPTVSYTITFT